MEEQIIKGRIGVMSLSSTEFAGLWGSPWGGDQQALGCSAFQLKNSLEGNISGFGVATLEVDDTVQEIERKELRVSQAPTHAYVNILVSILHVT